MKLIQRNLYLQRLQALNGTPDIKVVTGVRRCGKSVLMREYLDWLRRNEPEANIIAVNLSEMEAAALCESAALHQYVLDHYLPDRHNVVFIDEIQMCRGFEKAVNSLHAKGVFDLYLTGSNAFLLSSDLATLFTGRTMRVEVFPFSFAEYLTYFRPAGGIDAAFISYVQTGGFPGTYVYRTERDRAEYLVEVFRTIVMRDLVQKYKIRSEEELRKISEFMMDNVGNLLSPNNICETLNSARNSITRKTVNRFIGYLANAFVFYEARRYDLRGRKYLRSDHKYYLCDSGLRYALLGMRNLDYGRVYENLVYLELLRRGYTVYVGKLYKKEIDFVADKNSERVYIQVSDDISDEQTRKREYAPLLAIKDAYPKVILARTHAPACSFNGIIIMDLPEWLANASEGILPE